MESGDAKYYPKLMKPLSVDESGFVGVPDPKNFTLPAQEAKDAGKGDEMAPSGYIPTTAEKVKPEGFQSKVEKPPLPNETKPGEQSDAQASTKK